MTINDAILNQVTLNANTASVTIPIPGGYTHLKIVISARGQSSGVNNGCFMQINSVVSGYSAKDLYSSGTSAASSSNPYGITSKAFVGAINGTGTTTNTFGNKEIFIPNYLSNKAKAITTDSITETNGSTVYSDYVAGICSTTDPITSLTFTLDSSESFLAGSSFTVYGIVALGVTPTQTPKATGGDIIKNDGTYWYHAFINTGAFIPQTTINADVLVVAGGGGGGSTNGGGAGAGGLLGFASQSLTQSTSYVCTIGAGGVGAIGGGTVRGSNGVNSQFGSLTAAVGGGAGGSYSTSNGVVGGSGGGGAGADVLGSGASGTTSQGNAGYGGAAGQVGGGGGGAGVAATGKNGGNGSSSYSAWGLATSTGENVSGTVYYAGGGGGGTNSGAGGDATTAGSGGYGGGASGRNQASLGQPAAASINTGGGGGASGGNGNTAAGGNGGSGIVIVRYLMA